MKIKDQIKSRREQLGVTVNELARRVGVSHQSVRHWEAGRSFPGKAKAPKLEDALSFRLDWTQGVRSRRERPDATALLDQADIEIMLVIRRLPMSVKMTMVELANLYLEAIESTPGSFTTKTTEAGVGSFSIKESAGELTNIKRSSKRGTKKAARRAA